MLTSVSMTSVWRSGALRGAPRRGGGEQRSANQGDASPSPFLWTLSPIATLQGDREIPALLRQCSAQVAGMTSRSNCSIMKRGVFGPFQGFFLFQNETKWAFFAFGTGFAYKRT